MNQMEAPLLRIALCLIAGIVMGDALTVQFPWMPVFVGMAAATWLARKWAQVQSLLICLSFVVLGALLAGQQKEKLQATWPEGETRYEAVIMSEPVEKPKTVAVDLLLTKSRRKVKGYIHKDERSRALRLGDGLHIQSRISENSSWRRGSFDYRRYLETHGFTGTTFIAGWNWQHATVSLRELSYLERSRLFFLQQRSRLLKRFAAQGLENDEYAVVAAMALGDKSVLTKELKDMYSLTGASHVLALSGLHLGIIYMLLSVLVVGRRWRMASQLLVILSIWAYVFLVGLPVSVVRSAVMLTVYALLSLGHRQKMSVNVLAFTAIVMLCCNPMALFDVGFQLSFMAVFAILLFMPLLEGAIPRKFLLTHRLVNWLWAMVCISLSAQTGVAPLIAFYFGRFSTWFLLTNFIVVPAATLILYLSLLVLLIPSCAMLLIYAVRALNYILSQIASLPLASIDGLQPSMWQVALMYIVIGAVWLWLKKTAIRAPE